MASQSTQIACGCNRCPVDHRSVVCRIFACNRFLEVPRGMAVSGQRIRRVPHFGLCSPAAKVDAFVEALRAAESLVEDEGVVQFPSGCRSLHGFELEEQWAAVGVGSTSTAVVAAGDHLQHCQLRSLGSRNWWILIEDWPFVVSSDVPTICTMMAWMDRTVAYCDT